MSQPLLIYSARATCAAVLGRSTSWENFFHLTVRSPSKLSELKNALAAAIGVAALFVLSLGRVSMRCTCAAPGRAPHDDRIACISPRPILFTFFFLFMPLKTVWKNGDKNCQVDMGPKTLWVFFFSPSIGRGRSGNSNVCPLRSHYMWSQDHLPSTYSFYLQCFFFTKNKSGVFHT